MSEHKSGGPAFPTERFDNALRGLPNGYHGMTLRDWFAGQALAGMVAHPQGGGGPDVLADYAYRYADAMLKEREKA